MVAYTGWYDEPPPDPVDPPDVVVLSIEWAGVVGASQYRFVLESAGSRYPLRQHRRRF